MQKQSWFFLNGLYYTILAIVILIHLILLLMRFYHQQRVTQLSRPGLKITMITKEKNPATPLQVVQSEDPKVVTAPKKALYLSDKNRHVDRQSLARVVAPLRKAGSPLSLSDLGVFAKGHNPLKTKKVHHSQVAQPSRANDYVEQVPLGDLTYLNTAQYKYYGFFYRIRQRLEQYWGKSLEEKVAGLMKLGRRIKSGENLITTLIVILSEVGEILTILIKGSSGVQELDDAAKTSFMAAGPFPHPPKGLVHQGRVKIEWGFVVNPR